MVAGREFTEDDRTGNERVVIVSQSVAQRLFPNGDALNRKLWWTGSLNRRASPDPMPSRIVGVVADVDDENVDACAGDGCLSPHTGGRACRCACSCATSGDPYALVPSVTRIIRDAVGEPGGRARRRRSRTCAPKC